MGPHPPPHPMPFPSDALGPDQWRWVGRCPLTVLSQGLESPVLLVISPSWRLWDCAGGCGWVIYVLLAQAVGWPGSLKEA